MPIKITNIRPRAVGLSDSFKNKKDQRVRKRTLTLVKALVIPRGRRCQERYWRGTERAPKKPPARIQGRTVGSCLRSSMLMKKKSGDMPIASERLR